MPCILSTTTYIQNTLKYIKNTLLTKHSLALCSAFLATGDFDTFTGEIFGFHDEFYVEFLPRNLTTL